MQYKMEWIYNHIKMRGSGGVEFGESKDIKMTFGHFFSRDRHAKQKKKKKIVWKSPHSVARFIALSPSAV